MISHNQKFYLKNLISTHNSQLTVNNYAHAALQILSVSGTCMCGKPGTPEHHADLACHGFHANMHV